MVIKQKNEIEMMVDHEMVDWKKKNKWILVFVKWEMKSHLFLIWSLKSIIIKKKDGERKDEWEMKLSFLFSSLHLYVSFIINLNLILPPSLSLKKKKWKKLTSSSFPLFNIFKQEISSLQKKKKGDEMVDCVRERWWEMRW